MNEKQLRPRYRYSNSNVWMIYIVLVLSFCLLYGENQKVIKPRILSYELEIGIFPDARMDYAGFIEVLEGKRPDWNKEDSINNYPHIKGIAHINVDLGTQPRESIDFYIQGELRTHLVKCDSKDVQFTEQRVFYPMSYSMVANKVTVKLKGNTGKHMFTISYGGVFSPSYEGSPSNYMRIDKNGAYLRAYGYSLWFPILQKSGEDSYTVNFTSVKITTPKRFISVFTGERISETFTGTKRTSLWKADEVNLFYAGLTARPYILNRKRGIFLYYLDNPRSISASRDILEFVNKLTAFFTEHYKKINNTPQLHITELPNFASGISSGNMIGITSGQWHRFSLTDRDMGMELLVSHELVHSFVQPEISMQSPLAALFIEGFPSYFHLHALAEISGEEWYQDYILRIEKSYMKKKKTGKSHRGKKLPAEKPILSLTFGDIGKYKDTFILNDRVRLFLNYLREKMGKKLFKTFTRKLCSSKYLTSDGFKKLVLEFIPGAKEDIRIWLETSEYPDHFLLKR